VNTTISRTAETVTQIPVRDGMLAGDLHIPVGAKGIVIFVHGSGSGRQSPRNQLVAKAVGADFATLVPDLLTEAEEQEDELTGALRFDTGFLTSRLIDVIHWVAAQPETRELGIGVFGAGTGAAVAITAAAMEAPTVRAVVSRSGRPDLVGRVLALLSAPTLLIVGGDDVQVLALNRDAYSRMRCDKRLTVVPGATHLFEEPGTLEAVTRHAAEWFNDHLPLETSPGKRARA